MLVGIIIAAVVIFLIIGFAGMAKQNQEEKEVAETVRQGVSQLEDFEATKTVEGPLDQFKVMFDQNREKVAYVSKYGTRVFSFEDIISVELQESGTTVSKKSTSRTVGGAVLGGVLAGGAGAIIGGLSGSSTERRNVSSIIVKVTLRDVNDPTVNIVCFENYKLPPYSDEPGMAFFYEPAIQITDTLNVIIDLVDKRSNPQPEAPKQQETTNLSDEIAKLHGMLKNGIITEEEFAKMKGRLINK